MSDASLPVPTTPVGSRKRAGSFLEEDFNVKRLKRIWDDETPQSWEEALAEIAFLKRQLSDVLEFIDTRCVQISAPPAINNLLNSRARGATALAQTISKKMSEAYEPIYDQTFDSRRTGVTSDDLSRAMARFIPQIEELARLDDDDALGLAYHLVFQVKNNSYGDTPGDGECDRPSDKPADALLAHVIRQRVEAGQVWNWAKDLGDLSSEAKSLEEYGIDEWFPESRRALRELVARTHGEEALPLPKDELEVAVEDEAGDLTPKVAVPVLDVDQMSKISLNGD
ncbi:hypothetical protein B0T22DRAFT_463500 [Podospora appendiculata]|uniref:Uncharacterized protein n=1 Tax=Podospora appendiculata TaxID=314037 RepID=A0AAE0XD61_9PEZI|nr:hypothetical protein B0T22DRAFT_463500 [Podospora appendiculata]